MKRSITQLDADIRTHFEAIEFRFLRLYRNIQLIMFLKNLFVLTNQIEILYFEFIKRELENVTTT